MDGRDLASESLHAKCGHCVADITGDRSAIGFFFLLMDGGVLRSCDGDADLPGCDLAILSAVVSMEIDLV